MKNPCYRIKAIHRQDCYYEKRKSLIGEKVIRIDPNFKTWSKNEWQPYPNLTGWNRGKIHIENDHYYFLGVKLERC